MARLWVDHVHAHAHVQVQLQDGHERLRQRPQELCHRERLALRAYAAPGLLQVDHVLLGSDRLEGEVGGR